MMRILYGEKSPPCVTLLMSSHMKGAQISRQWTDEQNCCSCTLYQHQHHAI